MDLVLGSPEKCAIRVCEDKVQDRFDLRVETQTSPVIARIWTCRDHGRYLGVVLALRLGKPVMMVEHPVEDILAHD